MGQTRTLFVYLHSFLNSMISTLQNLTINGKTIDGVHGIQTRTAGW